MPPQLRHAVIALGNFDGFHKGHQAVVAVATQRARETGRPLIVATFDPHPVAFFASEKPSFMLTNLDQRQALFEEAGAEAMLVIKFGHAIANLAPSEFIEQLVAGHFGASCLVTGPDFRFGKGRQGDTSLIRKSAPRVGLDFFSADEFVEAGDRVSSSRIRKALLDGDCDSASRMLTRPFSFRASGTLRSSDDLLTFAFGSYIKPASGKYLVSVRDSKSMDHSFIARIRQNSEILDIFLPNTDIKKISQAEISILSKI